MVKNKGVAKKVKKPAFDISHFWNKHWARILITVLVFGILAFIGINKLIIYQQKQQFDAAEASLDKLYGDIVAQVGQPTDVKKDKSCSYASAEVGKGQLGCGFGYQLQYAVSDVSDANKIQSKAIQTFKTEHILKLKYIRELGIEDGKSSLPGKNTAGDLVCTKPITCSFSISYTDQKDHNLMLSITFGGPAKAEFYPVKN